MSANIFCNFCKHSWKIKRDYDKHISCCMYFNQLRRQPIQEEMDENGMKIPSVKELFRYVRDLSVRLEKTEKELARMKTVVNSRQKKMILEWLNQPNQKPEQTFEEWWAGILVNEDHMKCVFDRDLTEGIKSSIGTYIERTKTTSSMEHKVRPIRCFVQKPNVFYVYSRNQGTKELSDEPQWRIMDNAQMQTMVIHVAQLFLRVFLAWQKQKQQQENIEEDDEHTTDQMLMNMIKINGARTPDEKRVSELKKWLFPKIEENLRIVMECDFE